MLPRVVSMTAVAIRPHFRGSAASVGSLPTRPWIIPVSPLWCGAAHRGAQDGDWDNWAVLLVPFYRGDLVARVHEEGRDVVVDYTPEGALVRAVVGEQLAEALGEAGTPGSPSTTPREAGSE